MKILSLTAILLLLSLNLFSQSIATEKKITTVTTNTIDVNLGLVAYYPFNGNANDETGISANGIVYGPVLADDRHGVPNSAFEFDGVDDYIRIDYTSFDRTKSYTISLWFKSNALQEASELFVLGGNGHFFLQRGNDMLGFQTFLNGASTPSVFDDVKLDVWYHAVGTYDRQTGIQILYANGLKVAENNYGQYDSYIPNSTYSSIGSYYYPFVKRNFSGLIDDVRIYNRALTDHEIEALFEMEKPAVQEFATEVVEVTNPTTGRIWMDRNLGASRAATSSTDAEAYGDLYQWGRGADGHEKRNSTTTTTLSSTDQPGHGSFILAPDSPYDWRSSQNDNLWQGVNGVNNPCTVGYRLPTEAEWEAERASWSSNDSAGAFASPLKLPLAGGRSHNLGSLSSVGSYGLYWSGSVSGSNARNLYFRSSNADMDSLNRAFGLSVRCLKD